MHEFKALPANIIPRPVLGGRGSVMMLFRCLKRKYAEQFQRGEIYIGSPRNWIDQGKKGIIGQGDALEGIFLSTSINDNAQFIEILKKDSAIESFDHNGLTFFRRKAIFDLRCLCLYGLCDSAFQKEITKDGRANYFTAVSKEYFSDFTECKTREEFEAAEQDEQPVVILIKNPNEFFNRIIEFLIRIGVKKEEIIISPVEYLDKYVHMFSAIPSPGELLLKDTVFEKQSEIRIIVNCRAPAYMKYMQEHKNIISVGNLADITEIYDNYYDDMSIERLGNRGLMISLPEKKIFDIENLSFFELEDLLINILNGRVEIKGVSSSDSSWDEKLKVLSDLFEKKFGVYVHVDEQKKVFMYNLSQELLEQSHERYRYTEVRSKFEEKMDELISAGKLDEGYMECCSARNNIILRGAASYYLGRIFSLRRQSQEAIEAFHESYLADYKRIESLDGVASIWFQQSEYKKAIEVYNAIQEEKGYDCRIWCNIGICYIRLKEFDKAIEYFDKGIMLDREDAFPYYNKGVAYYMMNQHELAKRCMEEAMKLDPNNEIYHREYMKCFLTDKSEN